MFHPRAMGQVPVAFDATRTENQFAPAKKLCQIPHCSVLSVRGSAPHRVIVS